MPCEKNSCPSGSTSHHLPPTFSARKKPVALSCGPVSEPPYLSQSFGPGCAARSFASSSRRAARSASDMRLAGPVLVLVLAKRVNEREEWIGVRRPRGRRPVSAGGADLGDLENAVLGRLVHVDQQLGDVLRINRAVAAGRERIAQHAGELSAERVLMPSRQRDHHRVHAAHG